MPSGLYHPVPWRLAKWLSRVLVADDAIVARTTARIERWLADAAQPRILVPTAL
jgi:hypothetical protein